MQLWKQTAIPATAEVALEQSVDPAAKALQIRNDLSVEVLYDVVGGDKIIT